MVLVLGCASQPKRSDPVVRKFDIEGNRVLSDRQIKKKILTADTGWWPFATIRTFDPVVWGTDLQRIKRLYGSRGYYQAEVTGDRVVADGDDVALEVAVQEGQPTRIGSLEVTGLERFTAGVRVELVEELALEVGEVFEEGDWSAAKARLQEALRDRGYATARVDGVVLIGVATHQAALRIAVDTGGVYHFGAVEVDTGGGTAIPAAWIWEQARSAIPDGALYAGEALTEAQRRISNMGVFSAVAVTAGEPDRASGRIAVRVSTREAPFHTLKLGGGIRIDQIRNEARLIGEWTNRNFLGGMRRLVARGEAGWAFIPNTYAVLSGDQASGPRNGPIARVRLEFEQPRFLGRPSLRERSSLELVRTLEQTYDDLGARITNGVVWQPRSSLSIYPSHHFQGDHLTGPPSAAVLTAPLTLGCRTSGNSCLVWLSYLEEVVTWDRRDDPLQPRNGFYASLSLQQGGGPLQGNFSYYRVLPDVRGYVSFGEDDQLTFAARLRVGQLLTTSGQPDDSAVVTRFYGGGAQSMRGFNDRRLSPLLLTQLPASVGNPNPPIVTLPIGGNGMIDGSMEVRYALTANLIVAAFLDFGQVTRGRLQPSDFAHLLVAVGAGLRYRTPVGPIRVDFARRLQMGRPPPLLVVDGAGLITTTAYDVNDSCFGLGGSHRQTVVADNLCVLHISIGEAF